MESKMELFDTIEKATTHSGIYCVFNIVSGKQYIGSAVNMSDRIRRHKGLLRRRKHHSVHLQNAWDKYGEENFIFLVIEYVDIENLIEREQYFIDLFDFEELYNICPTAGSHLGRKCSDETKKKLSEAHKGKVISEEQRRQISTANKGKVFSEEHKRKLKCKIVSEETRKKISESRKGYVPSAETRHKLSEARSRMSDETRRKISEGNKGKKRSEETRKKISEVNKGRVLTEEQRRKSSEAHKGKKLSDEARKKMSEAQNKRRLREKNK